MKERRKINMKSFIESLGDLVSGRAFIPVYAIVAHGYNGYENNDFNTAYLVYLFAKNKSRDIL